MQGVLNDTYLDEELEVWDISCSWIADTVLVQAWTRKGPGHMWTPPVFYLSTSNNYVRIVDDLKVEPYDEFLIVGIVP